VSRIEDYALIGDLQTAALVGVDGSVDWMCLPRFDSPACFAALLDDERAGRWVIASTSRERARSRRYLPGTLVLETTWDGEGGTARVLDLMPPRTASPTLVRIVEGLSGTVSLRSELRLRFDYGHVVPWVVAHDDGIEAVAGPDRVRVRTPVELRGEDWTTVADVTVRAGDRIPFVLTWSPSHTPAPEPIDADAALGDTLGFWHEWSGRSTAVTGGYGDAVTRSLITLKALTHEPTGGIVAAATTSLPEAIGGSRNWDYRFCWLRDSTFTLQAMLAAGYLEEARAWREWLLRAVAGDPATLQIMYAVDGARRLPETELPWLRGYESSSPVRTGNAAADQLQLDVWGETLDALHLAREAGMDRDDAWDLQVALMEHLEGNWQSADNGLWEIRGPVRSFTHSKLMAWVAADRMTRAVTEQGLGGPAARWSALRDTIRADILEHGYDQSAGTFTQSYGSSNVDASLLLIPRVGFLPGTDPRVLGTIEAVQQRLTVDGLVRRYDVDGTDDGLPGGEGLFLACSFWLVDALHGADRHAEATRLFEHLLSLRNDVGLLSEQWDPRSRRQLGNTPQAFSHFALVVSAVGLAHERPHRSDEPVNPSARRDG
jgi:GH15 family glucan-1,4-alpha-glucosidase